MVVDTHNNLQKIKRNFNEVKDAADKFVKWAKNNLNEQMASNNLQEEDEDLETVYLEVESSLPQRRQRRTRLMGGEMSPDETPFYPNNAYELKVHDNVMNTVIQNHDHRFIMIGTLYADLSLLDPRNVEEINKDSLPDMALQKLSTCFLGFNSEATMENLQSELKNLAAHRDKLKQLHLEPYRSKAFSETSEEISDENEINFVIKECSSCRNCVICCFKILQRYNLLTDAYRTGLAYNFLFILSVTQVACERSFFYIEIYKKTDFEVPFPKSTYLHLC